MILLLLRKKRHEINVNMELLEAYKTSDSSLSCVLFQSEIHRFN